MLITLSTKKQLFVLMLLGAIVIGSFAMVISSCACGKEKGEVAVEGIMSSRIVSVLKPFAFMIVLTALIAIRPSSAIVFKWRRRS